MTTAVSTHRVHAFWQRQVEAEYSSAAISAAFAQWLLRVGASPDLVKQCLDIAKDEVDHAQLCYQVVNETGGNTAVNFDDKQLCLHETYDDLRKNTLNILLNVYCLGETVAVPLFSGMMKNTTQATALEAYQRIIADEPRHSGFGWLGLAWMHSAWPETQMWLEELFPSALHRIARRYVKRDEYHPQLSEDELAWGMLSKQEYVRIFEHAVLKLYAKNLQYYHIDVKGVWANIRPSLT